MAWTISVYSLWVARADRSKSPSVVMPMSRTAATDAKVASRAAWESFPNT